MTGGKVQLSVQVQTVCCKVPAARQTAGQCTTGAIFFNDSPDLHSRMSYVAMPSNLYRTLPDSAVSRAQRKSHSNRCSAPVRVRPQSCVATLQSVGTHWQSSFRRAQLFVAAQT